MKRGAKKNLDRNLVVKFTAMLVKYDAATNLALFNKISEAYPYKILFYYITFPDYLSTKIISTLVSLMLKKMSHRKKMKYLNYLGTKDI